MVNTQGRKTTTIPYFTHRLKSKTATSNEVLIITSYDYFLEKRCLALLLKDYIEIIMVPRTVDDDFLLNKTISPLINQYEKIHLITNPQYDARYDVIYELVIRSNKSIRVTTIYDFCEKTLKKIYIPNDIQETNPYLPENLSFGLQTRILKNGIDSILSIFLLLLTFPVWLISAFRIQQDSPGEVFYRQERVGFREKIFHIIKFRSMGMDAESNGAQFSQKKDVRIFPYGALMRTTRIDELPQLFNIFMGEISLIGPRPERPVFTETFAEIIPYYNLRHLVKPGITGYAQVMYNYGAGAFDARHKLMYDLYYIKNWSVLLELKIIAITAFVILTKKGR